MIDFKITPNKQWLEASKFFAEMPKRFDWFQFEFSKRATFVFYKLLTNEVQRIRSAPKDYRKRLVVAEMRDSSSKSWFAVAVTAKSLKKSDRDIKTTIFSVITRFPNLPGFDPIRDVLQAYGPWTADTMPFLPSIRYAIVVAKQVTPGMVELVKDKNKKDMTRLGDLMGHNGIAFDLRSDVVKGLHVIEDFEKVIEEIEFGNGPKKHVHWSKSLRIMQAMIVRKLMVQRDLLASITDPKFKKYRVKVHLKRKMNSREMREFEKFQRRVLRYL